MEFSKKKLPGDKVKGMTQVNIVDVKPYNLIWTPAYVFFKANDKLLGIKRPLDFFSQSELEAIKAYEFLYFAPYLTDIAPIQAKAKKLRDALRSEIEISQKIANDRFGDIPLPMTTFELSDFALRTVASVWSKDEEKGMSVELVLVTAFISEICDPIPPEKLEKAREKSAVKFTNAIVRSHWVVFLAMHLGYCNFGFLNRVLNRTFEDVMNDMSFDECSNEFEELLKFAMMTCDATNLKLFRNDILNNRKEKIAQKIETRLERVSKDLMDVDEVPPSIFGKKGFIDG